jgi:hypothetical protein
LRTRLSLSLSLLTIISLLLCSLLKQKGRPILDRPGNTL